MANSLSCSDPYQEALPLVPAIQGARRTAKNACKSCPPSQLFCEPIADADFASSIENAQESFSTLFHTFPQSRQHETRTMNGKKLPPRVIGLLNGLPTSLPGILLVSFTGVWLADLCSSKSKNQLTSFPSSRLSDIS